MISIVIGDYSCIISEEQCKWFKTLVNAYEYLRNESVSPEIRLPNVIADQTIDMSQFRELVDCYQTQINSNAIDINRARSILEHYLEGILDDLDGEIKEIHNFLQVNTSNPILYNIIKSVVVSKPLSIASSQYFSHTHRVCYLGNIDVLDYFIEHLDKPEICQILASYGHLNCLIHAHTIGCPWDEETCNVAVEHGYLDILQYAHNNGCPWDENTCAHAAHSGRLDILQYLHQNKCPWDEITCVYAAHCGHLNILKYAHDNGCPWNDCVCSSAARNSNIEIIEYLHTHGCPWNENTCLSAAHEGNLNILKYVHDNGCPWHEWTCEFAAECGHLDCLQYAHENGCPWDSNTIYYVYNAYMRAKGSQNSGNLTPYVTNLYNCLKYAIYHGCPMDKRVSKEDVENALNIKY